MKQNCWEFKECGREAGGKSVAEFGVCPATEETRLNNVHGGKNAGRACWVIAGTFCGDKAQGTFAQKEKTCLICDFYKSVRKEEGKEFQMYGHLVKTLAA